MMQQTVAQFVGCTVMGIGIAFEVRCGSVTMPGEGLPVAISRVTGRPFPKIKIAVDVSLVVLSVVSCYMFWAHGSGILSVRVHCLQCFMWAI